jgi:hypothetical protein
MDQDIEISEHKTIDYSDGVFRMNTETARRIALLYRVQPSLARTILAILISRAKNSDSIKKSDFSSFVSDIKVKLSPEEILAHIIWFDIFCQGINDDIFSVKRHVLERTIGFNYNIINNISAEVERINEGFLGRKRILKQNSSYGAIEADSKKRVSVNDRRGIRQLVDLIFRLANVTSRITALPMNIAASNGEFDSMSAYLLGQKRLNTLTDIIAKTIDRLMTGRGIEEKDAILDLNIFRDILEST